MNEKFLTLIENLEKTSGLKEFFDELEIYFSKNLSNLHLDIIKIVPFPPHYLKLKDSQINKSLLLILSESQNAEYKNRFLVVNNYYIFPLAENSITRYLLIFKGLSNHNFDEIYSLCGCISSLYNLAVNSYRYGLDESDLQNANLISQMSHDINSMNSLIKRSSPEIDESVLNKMNYIEKMTKDVLQYVREIQILDSKVEIEKLLESIIQNIVFPENIEVSTRYNLKEKVANLDVELIDRALNEIIQNAVSSFEKKNGNIIIKANIRQVKNIFYNNEYLEIIIEDNGTGINADFLSFIKNPFFTTKKSEHHSGLGLSIADKIINAHGGYLNIEINEENKTAVTIYLPLQGNDNE